MALRETGQSQLKVDQEQSCRKTRLVGTCSRHDAVTVFRSFSLDRSRKAIVNLGRRGDFVADTSCEWEVH
jgi:hypothetical protein